MGEALCFLWLYLLVWYCLSANKYKRKKLKNFVEFLNKKDLHFKSLNEIQTKQLGSRKKIKIYDSTSIKSEYIAIFIVESKSRFLRKNVDELELLLDALIKHKDHNYKKKYLFISSPLCSKAKLYLKELSWGVFDDFM